MSNILKIVILSPACQLGGMFAGGAIGTLVHGSLPGHTPGRYVYYCGSPGHRAAGMEGSLIVDP